MIIELTDEDGKAFLVNFAYIVEVQETENGCVLFTPFLRAKTDVKVFKVKETLEEIKMMLGNG
jgi:hypothetical protein